MARTRTAKKLIVVSSFEEPVHAKDLETQVGDVLHEYSVETVAAREVSLFACKVEKLAHRGRTFGGRECWGQFREANRECLLERLRKRAVLQGQYGPEWVVTGHRHGCGRLVSW